MAACIRVFVSAANFGETMWTLGVSASVSLCTCLWVSLWTWNCVSVDVRSVGSLSVCVKEGVMSKQD